jgi:hypothetical protein
MFLDKMLMKMGINHFIIEKNAARSLSPRSIVYFLRSENIVVHFIQRIEIFKNSNSKISKIIYLNNTFIEKISESMSYIAMSK